MPEYFIKETGELVDAQRIELSGEVRLDRGNTTRAHAGDWLITYPDGSKRVCSANAFESLYSK